MHYVAKFVWCSNEAVQILWCGWRVVNCYPTLPLSLHNPCFQNLHKPKLKSSLSLCFHISISHFLQILHYIFTSSSCCMLFLSLIWGHNSLSLLSVLNFICVFSSITFGFLFVIHSMDVSAKGFFYALIMWSAASYLCQSCVMNQLA